MDSGPGDHEREHWPPMTDSPHRSVPWEPPPPSPTWSTPSASPRTRTRRAGPGALITLTVLIMGYVLVLVWGTAVAFRPTGRSGQEYYDYYCRTDGGHLDELAAPLWPAWLTLVVITGLIAVGWLGAGRGDRRFAVATGVTAALTAITCPIIFLILSGIDCGL